MPSGLFYLSSLKGSISNRRVPVYISLLCCIEMHALIATGSVDHGQTPHSVPSDHGLHCLSLRKHAYSNILRNLPPRNGNFKMKNSGSFHNFAQNIDCRYSLEPPRRGISNEYPQSMFLSRNKKINVYPCKPQFYSIKVGFKGVKII